MLTVQISKNFLKVNKMSKATLKDIIFDLETTGIDPLNCRITAVGFLDMETGEIDIIVEKSEKKLIKRIADKLKVGGLRLIGWRIRGFDIPFLVIRALKYKMDTAAPNRIYELSEYFQNSPVRIDSHNLAQYLGLHYTLTSGRMMPKEFHNGNIEVIKEHLTDDLIMIKEIYEYIKEVWKI